jgi:hypothetical protein
MIATKELQSVDVLKRKKFTRDEVYRMLNAGIFEGQRLELINGDIIDKMGQNPPHSFGIKVVGKALVAMLGFGRVRV